MFDVTRKAINDADTARVNINTKITNIETVLNTNTADTDKKIKELNKLNEDLSTEYNNLLKNRSQMFFLVRLVLWFLKDSSISEKVTSEIAKITDFLRSNPLVTKTNEPMRMPQETPVEEVKPPVVKEPVAEPQPVERDVRAEAEAELNKREAKVRMAKANASPAKSTEGLLSGIKRWGQNLMRGEQKGGEGLLPNVPEERRTLPVRNSQPPMAPISGSLAKGADALGAVLGKTDTQVEAEKRKAYFTEKRELLNGNDYKKYYQTVEELLAFRGFTYDSLQFFVERIRVAMVNGQDPQKGLDLIAKIVELQLGKKQ